MLIELIHESMSNIKEQEGNRQQAEQEQEPNEVAT
jgi:hypothetical protein